MKREKRKEKYYIVDGKIRIRFAVVGLNEGDAKDNAVRTIKKLLETSLFGSFGYSFEVERITETQPIERQRDYATTNNSKRETKQQGAFKTTSNATK